MPDANTYSGLGSQYSGLDSQYAGVSGSSKGGSRKIIKIDGILLPGHFRLLQVGQDIVIDEMQVQDKDGHIKQPAGYDEGKIKIEVVLIPDDGDVNTQLASIYGLFRKVEGQIKPDIHSISNIHANSRGIKKILFNRLESTESEEDDSLAVKIELEEYVPVAVQVQNAVFQQQQQDVASSVLPTATASAAAEVSKDTGKP